MAGQNGLWFELGVRDINVVKTLEALQRQSALVGAGFDAATRNLNTMIGAMYKIAEVRNRLTQSRDNSKILGVDTKRIDDAIRRLDAFKSKLNSLQMGSNAKSNKDVIGAALGTEFNVMIKSLQGLVREQNNYNAAAERGGRQNWSAQMRAKAVATQQAAAAAQQAARAEEELIRQMQRASQAGVEQGRIFQEMRNWVMSYFSFYGAKNLLQSIIQVGGAFEVQHVALQNILGDLSKANQMFSELKELAIKSPKSFRELTSDAKMLAAYSIPANELFETTKRLADLSSGLGVSMNRLILAYGQVRSASVLRGQELRQFTEAGVPMVDALAKKFTQLKGELVTTRQILTEYIPKKKVPFSMVKEVIDDMTSEGGKFYNMQFVLSDTLAGKWSNLKDAWEIMLSEIAEGYTMSGRILKGAVSGITNLIRGMNTLLPLIKAVGVAWIATGLGSRFLGFSGSYNSFYANYSKQRQSLYNGALAAQLTGSRELSKIEKSILASKTQISSVEAGILAKSQLITATEGKRLFLQGRLSKYGLARLATEKLITVEEYRQLAAMGRFGRAWALVGMQIKAVAVSIRTMTIALVKNPFFLAMAAISSVMFVFEKISQINDKVRKAEEETLKTNQEKSKVLRDALKGLSGKKDKKSLLNDIEAINAALKEHAGNYKMISDRAKEISDIGKRYEYLRGELEAVSDAYDRLANERAAALAAEAERETGGMFASWDNFFSGDWDSVDDDLKDYAKSYRDFENEASKAWRKFGAEFGRALDHVRTTHKKFYDEYLKGKVWSEQARILLSPENAQYGQVFANYLGYNAREGFYGLNSSYVEQNKDRGEVLKEIDKRIDVIRRGVMSEQHLKSNREFEEWASKNAQEMALRIQNSANQLQNISKEKLLEVMNYMSEKLWHVKWFVTVETNEEPLTKLAEAAWRKLKGNISEDGSVDIPGKGVTRKDQLNAIFPNQSDAVKDAIDAIESAKSNLENTPPWMSKDDAIEDLNKANAYYTFLTGKKYAGKDKGNKTDKVLKKWKQRMSQLEELRKLYETFAKTMSDIGALGKVRDSGLSFANILPDDIVDEKGFQKWINEQRRKAIKALTGSSEERTTFKDKLLSEIAGVAASDITKELALIGEHLERAIQEGTEKWDLYKKIKDSTGDVGIAGLLAYGDRFAYKQRPSDMIAQAISLAMPDYVSRSGAVDMSFEELVELFKKNGEEGTKKAGYGGLVKMIQQYVQTQRKEKSEDATRLAEAIKSTQNAYEKMLAEVSKINEQRTAVAGSNLSQGEKDAIKGALDAKEADLRLKASLEYVQFFGSVLSLTSKQVEDMGRRLKDNLNEQLRRGGISADEYYKELKRINGQMEKFRKHRSNGWALFAGGINGLNKNREERYEDDAAKWAAERKDASEKLTVAQKLGDEAAMAAQQERIEKAKEEEEIALRHLEIIRRQKQAMEDLETILDKSADLAKGIDEGMGKIMDMGEALGWDVGPGSTMHDIKTATAIFSGITGGARDTLKSALKGDLGGVISGIIGIFTGPVTAFAKLHDERLERQIQLAEERNRLINNVKEVLEKKFERILGGIYAIRLDTATRTKLSDIQKAKGIHSSDTRSTASAAINADSYYLGELALMKAQRDNAQIQLNSESDKKKRDDVKISDYQKKLSELDDQIVHFAEDMAKTLYDIDLKSWASELGDALFEAWSKGENAMDAYKEKLQELIGKTAKNIITTRILEKAFDGPLKKLVQIMDASNGVLTETNIQPFLDSLMQATEMSIPALEGAYGVLEKWMNTKGMTLKETGSASGGNTIKGITEDQADIIIAYINGMRADLSMQIRVIKQLAESNVPNMQNTFELQLLQLRKIEANTNRSADNTDEIVSVLSSVVNGTKKFAVK